MINMALNGNFTVHECFHQCSGALFNMHTWLGGCHAWRPLATMLQALWHTMFIKFTLARMTCLFQHLLVLMNNDQVPVSESI